MKKLLMMIPALCLGLVLTGCGETDTPAPATNGTEAAGADAHTDEATDMGAESETPAGEMPAAAGGTTEGEAAPDAPPAEPEEKLPLPPGEKPAAEEGDKPAAPPALPETGDKPAEEKKPAAEGDKPAEAKKPAAEGDKPADEKKPAEEKKPAASDDPAEEDEVQN